MEGCIAFLVFYGLFWSVPTFIFWVPSFSQLMARPDSDFPGRYDKVLWCLTFISTAAVPFLAPVAYSAWNGKTSQPERQGVSSDHT